MILLSSVSFVCSILLLAVLIPVAYHFNLLANPGEHRHHAKPTPLVGGIAIFITLVISLRLFSIEIPLSLMLSMTLIWLFGLVDDIWTIPFWMRFVIQVITALILVNDGTILNNLGFLFSSEMYNLGGWNKFLTVFAIVGVINAVNMIDGLDGLAGTIVTIGLVSVIILLPAGQELNVVMMCVILVSSLLGFLSLNIRYSINNPVKIFMGDSGSMLLGLVLAWLLIKYSQNPTVIFPPVLALWILAVPLFDTVGVMLRRMARQQSPFHADRLHTHHLLQNLGCSVNQTLSIIAFAAIVFCVTGVAAVQYGVRERILFFTFLGLFTLYLLVMELGQRAIQE